VVSGGGEVFATVVVSNSAVGVIAGANHRETGADLFAGSTTVAAVLSCDPRTRTYHLISVAVIYSDRDLKRPC